MCVCVCVNVHVCLCMCVCTHVVCAYAHVCTYTLHVFCAYVHSWCMCVSVHVSAHVSIKTQSKAKGRYMYAGVPLGRKPIANWLLQLSVEEDGCAIKIM